MYNIIAIDTATEQNLVFCFLQEAPPSQDILVFMTGQEEIEALARTCRDIAKHLPDSCAPMVVIPLYASLPPVQQLRVFQPAPKVKAHRSTHSAIFEKQYVIRFFKNCVDHTRLHA